MITDSKGNWKVDRTQEQNSLLMGEINSLRELSDSRKQEFEQREAVIVEKLQTVNRIVSQPVIVGIASEDINAEADQQRLSHQSDDDNIIKLRPAKEYYTRRHLEINTRGGNMMLQASFINRTRNGLNVIVNPVLKPGETLEFVGLFVIDPNGNENAPADLEINGELVSPGTKGFYKLQIVTFNTIFVLWEEYKAKMLELEAGILAANNRALLKGEPGKDGTNGTNATTTATATATTSGLMSSESFSKLAGLLPNFGTANTPVEITLPAIALGGSTSFTIPVVGARIYMTATVNPIPNGTFLNNLSNWRAVITADDVVTVYLNAGLAIAAGKQKFAVRITQ